VAKETRRSKHRRAIKVGLLAIGWRVFLLLAVGLVAPASFLCKHFIVFRSLAVVIVSRVIWGRPRTSSLHTPLDGP